MCRAAHSLAARTGRRIARDGRGLVFQRACGIVARLRAGNESTAVLRRGRPAGPPETAMCSFCRVSWERGFAIRCLTPDCSGVTAATRRKEVCYGPWPSHSIECAAGAVMHHIIVSARFAPILLGAMLSCFTPAQAQNQNFMKFMEQMQRESKSDFEGPLGQRAIETCNRIHGIRGPIRNGQDVARLYGARKAMEWTDCVVDTMHPVGR
jgi:hypothetical protein